MPTWPDTTSQSPALTTGVYGPTGLAGDVLRPTLPRRVRRRETPSAGGSALHERVLAGHDQPPSSLVDEHVQGDHRVVDVERFAGGGDRAGVHVQDGDVVGEELHLTRLVGRVLVGQRSG